MEFDSKKLEAFHDEPTGIHMISWKLQTNETQERNGQMIPNTATKFSNFFKYRNGYLSLTSRFKQNI